MGEDGCLEPTVHVRSTRGVQQSASAELIRQGLTTRAVSHPKVIQRARRSISKRSAATKTRPPNKAEYQKARTDRN
jgi:hypothetical protein